MRLGILNNIWELNMNEIDIRRQAVNKMYMICLDVFLLGFSTWMLVDCMSFNSLLFSIILGAWGCAIIYLHNYEKLRKRWEKYSEDTLRLICMGCLIGGCYFLGEGVNLYLS